MIELEKIVLSLTNGGSNKPYWRWISNSKSIRVYVADDQVLCYIPSFEGNDDFADAICASGGIIDALSAEVDMLSKGDALLRKYISRSQKVGE